MDPQYTVGGGSGKKQQCINVDDSAFEPAHLSLFHSLSAIPAFGAIVSSLLEMLFPSFLWFSCFTLGARASVTVYSQQPLGAGTSTAGAPNATAAAYYDSTVLTAPPVPSPAPPTQFSLQLHSASQAVQNLSIPLSGDFLGFSIEFSVINQVSAYQMLFHVRVTTNKY
jgi:hypothetical protein